MLSPSHSASDKTETQKGKATAQGPSAYGDDACTYQNPAASRTLLLRVWRSHGDKGTPAGLLVFLPRPFAEGLRPLVALLFRGALLFGGRQNLLPPPATLPGPCWGEAVHHPQWQKTEASPPSHPPDHQHACCEVPVLLPGISTENGPISTPQDSQRRPGAWGQEIDPRGKPGNPRTTYSWPTLCPCPWLSGVPGTVFVWHLTLGLQAGPERVGRFTGDEQA